MDKVRLGVDFGTTTTAVSLRIGDEIPVALPIGAGRAKRYIPSVVFFPPGGQTLDAAIVGVEPEIGQGRGIVIHSIKRCLGCNGKRCAENKVANYYWCNGDGKVNIANVGVFDPRQIAFLIIRKALKEAFAVALESYGVELKDELRTIAVNLGCPAAFGLSERNTLVELAREFGFSNVNIDNVVEEPILAGFTFSRFDEYPDGRVLIYDFGGGSFDTAILDIDRVNGTQRITVLATAGQPWLGGDDIDTLIHKHFVEQIANTKGLSVDQVRQKLEPFDIWQLRYRSKLAKEALSDSAQFSDSLFSDSFDDVFPLDLSRNELENLILNTKENKKNLIERSLDAVLNACKLAYAFEVATQAETNSQLIDTKLITNYSLRQAASTIKKVVLVGGISKIPLVRSAVAQVFGKDKLVSDSIIEPIIAVAVGAAYPREPQHYSLAYPPFEIELELQKSSKGHIESMPIFEPFEYYRFHEAWATSSALPAHRSHPISIQRDYAEGVIRCRRAGDAKWAIQHPIGKISIGNWRFCVTLDGIVRMQYHTDAWKDLFQYPLVHPVQQQILQAREERLAREKRELIERTKQYEKTMGTEN